MVYGPVNTNVIVYSMPNEYHFKAELVQQLRQTLSNVESRIQQILERSRLLQEQDRLEEEEARSLYAQTMSNFDSVRNTLTDIGRRILANYEYRRAHNLNINADNNPENELLNPISGRLLLDRHLGTITTGQEEEFLPQLFRTHYNVFNLSNINLNNTQQVVYIINSIRFGLGLQPLTLNTIQIHLNSDFSEAANELRRLF